MVVSIVSLEMTLTMLARTSRNLPDSSSRLQRVKCLLLKHFDCLVLQK
jgi:hypothetical protein